jgi:hypothetical protein
MCQLLPVMAAAAACNLTQGVLRSRGGPQVGKRSSSLNWTEYILACSNAGQTENGAMTGMGKKRELRTRWQRACKLILAKEDVLTVSRALELALFMDAKLDVSKVPAK